MKSDSYIVMPCLSAPVYDVDVFSSAKVPSKCLFEAINPAGIPYVGNIVRKSKDSGICQKYCESYEIRFFT